VKGRTAVIGSVGEANTGAFPQDPNLDPPNASSLVTIVDGGPGVVDQVGGTRPTAPYVSRPDCAAPPAATAMTSQSVIVVDRP
jgi:hypothetical protein